tara:strand:- start:2598 stop:2891 length:294 start_codon:yes stop_codon:yes gene_type:complete
MTYQEFQAALHVLLGEIASIKVVLKGLDYAMHNAMNTDLFYNHQESWGRFYATLNRKEEDVVALECRYYAQFPLVPSQYDTVGFPSGVTNIYGHDQY